MTRDLTTRRRVYALRSLYLCTALLLACSGGSDPVAPPAVATVTIVPDSVNIIIGSSAQLAASLRDAGGGVLEGRVVTWSSPSSNVVVANSGAVIGVTPGRATINAMAEGKTGTAIVHVVLPPVATVTVVPDSFDLGVDETQQLSATLRSAADVVLTNRAVVWTTSDANVATVSGGGVVTAETLGRAVITATSEGKSDTAVVIVKIIPLDHAIANVQFTQATQAVDGSIPMVLSGNGVAVNVLVSANLPSATPTQVVLRLFDGGGSLVRADTAVTSGAFSETPTMLAPTVQFLLPPSALTPPMQWEVVRDPQGLVPDADPATDVFPRQGKVPLAMVGVPQLAVRFVPIRLTAHGNTTGIVDVADYLRTVQSIHPLGAVTTTVAASFATSQSFGEPPLGGDVNTFWSPVLGQLDLARLADADPTAYWVGVVLPPAGFTNISSGGIAYIPFSGSSSAQGTRTSLVTSVDWANHPAFARETMAHELGHNFGRRHAPCDGPSGVDPFYPHGGGFIGVPGFDVRGWMDGRAATALPVSPLTGDIMSYCYPVAWVSDYTYRGVLTFRGTVAAARGAHVAALSAPPARSLVVRGHMVRGRGITLEPALTLDVRPTQPERSGPYRLEGRARDGRVLFARDFAPSEIDHAIDVGHFTFAIPLSADLEDALATIEVRGPAGSARRDRPIQPPAARGAQPPAPVRLAGGVVRIACADASARGIAVRNTATGELLGVSGAAAMSVVATAGTSVQVVCSDGVVSSSATVIAR